MDAENNLICYVCVGNIDLKRYIRKNGSRQECNYCGHNKLSIDMEELVSEIASGISVEYEDANDVLGYDSSEGGFLGESL